MWRHPARYELLLWVSSPDLPLTLNEFGRTDVGDAIQLNGVPTLVDAIQKAGGITQQANLREIVLQRRLPGTGSETSYKQATFNLLDVVLNGNHSQNPYLFDGDTIRIAKAELTPQVAVELASANLSPQVINVNVIGEVNNPGRFELSANTPLVQAVLAAGGPSSRANKRNVELVRINRNGSLTLKRFQINLSEPTSNQKNPPLRDGDSVLVNPTQAAKAADLVNSVTSPLTGLFPLWTMFSLFAD